MISDPCAHTRVSEEKVTIIPYGTDRVERAGSCCAWELDDYEILLTYWLAYAERSNPVLANCKVAGRSAAVRDGADR
jgi:hypothetical protein